MKKIILMSGVFFLSMAALFAQEKANTNQAPQSRVEMKKMNRNQLSPEQRAEIKANRLDKTVALSVEQKSKVKAVYLKEAQQNQDRMTVHQSTQNEIKSILTADQNQILEKTNQDKMAEMRQRRALNRSEIKAAPVQKTPEAVETKQ